ncbi:TetR/AcrR family transcriptional regulator [Enterococcus asini]|uniref:TetR/AcrR family transcriptional regulator n=1 Tax=Enterococcus asini TaxID=57732 RepID=UPI001E48CCAA|nr:TetR/AcrR family transcriptional regulator [Enterococcus asini]MCD5029643.1 TetR/AcrR family transcriptional regulator [Enterococcus asini]
MRRVVYTRRMILSQTKRYIIQNGFRNVTARNLAAYMEMSTQPLYKQFDSIQGLQQELVEEHFHKLAQEYASQKSDQETSLQDFADFFVARSQKEYPWFTQLFLTKKRDDSVAECVNQCSYELFKSLCNVEDNPDLKEAHDAFLALLIGAAVWQKQQKNHQASAKLGTLLQPQLNQLVTVNVQKNH